MQYILKNILVQKGLMQKLLLLNRNMWIVIFSRIIPAIMLDVSRIIDVSVLDFISLILRLHKGNLLMLFQVEV